MIYSTTLTKKKLESNTDGASLDQLILNGVISQSNSVTSGPEGDESRATNIEMVMARNESTNLPPNPAVNLNDDKDVTVILVLAQPQEVIRSNRNIGSVNKRRPNINLLVTLVRRRNSGTVRYLLATVGNVGVEAIVVYSDFVVGVARRKCDLKV